jgi:general secretion pathway protein N
MTGWTRLKPAAGYIGLGVLLYLIFLVATAPAIWFAKTASRFTDGAISLTRTRGTVWRGSAELHAGAAASGVRDLGRFQWRTQPWWLLLGRAQFSVQLEGSAMRCQAALAVAPWRRVRVTGLEASFPASLVSLVYGPAAFFEPTGTIELRAADAELSAAGLVATIEAQWRGAGGRFTGPATLGDYRIDIAASGETAAIHLTTLRGNLELTGQGRWQVTGDGAIQFNGSAIPKADAAELEPLLRSLGRDLGGGRRQIRFNGRLPLVRQLGL